jgi:hypothetical protein
MATKVRLMKLIEEVRGYAQITNRRPAPRPPVLYLMELRAHAAQNDIPRRRLDVATDARENPTRPLPIKITHISPEESLPIVLG